MKEKLTRNIGLKVLSIVLALLLWLVITNVEDPIRTEKFRDVPVKIVNDNVIASLDKVYDIVKNETIDFTVQARRSILEDLTINDFDIIADFKNLSEVNAVPIEVICNKYSDNEVDIISGNTEMMQIDLVEVVDEEFKITVETVGEVAEGYHIVEKKASPMMITISGPKSRVESIKEVVVEVQVAGATSTIQVPVVKPIVRDSNGDTIDDSNLSFSNDYISANVVIYKTKEINVELTVIGSPAQGYKVTGQEHAPKKVTIAGSEEALSKCPYLKIEQRIFGNKKSIIDQEINLQDLLPNGVILVGEDKTGVINITIEKLETKSFSMRPEEIEMRDMPQGMSALYNTSTPITISVSGTSDEIGKVTKDSLNPFIDLTGYPAGIHTLEIQCDLPDNIHMGNSPKISITIS